MRSSRRTVSFLIAFLMLLAVRAHGAGEIPAPTAENAEALFTAHRWPEAVTANEAVVRIAPDDGRAWFRLGISNLRLRRFDAAADALQRAGQCGYASPFLPFGLASIAAARHQNDEALSQLHLAVAAGFSDMAILSSDENLKSLAGEAGYRALVDRIERPCEADPRYHELDFWIGHWDAIAGGVKNGTNILEKTLGGCVVIENWTEASDNHEVKSFFVYNPATRERKQIWVSDRGVTKERIQVADPEPGSVHSVRFVGEVVQKDGTTVIDRSTLKPLSADRVHQRIEISRDSGRSWELNWEADYVRQKPTGS